MRQINILQDIEEVLLQLVSAIPDVFLVYDLTSIELMWDDGGEGDEDRKVTIPTVAEIVVVEDEDTELVIGEIALMEDYTAYIEIFED